MQGRKDWWNLIQRENATGTNNSVFTEINGSIISKGCVWGGGGVSVQKGGIQS